MKRERDEDWMFIWAHHSWWLFGDSDLYAKRIQREAPVTSTQAARFGAFCTMADRGPFDHVPRPERPAVSVHQPGTPAAPQMYWLDEGFEPTSDETMECDDESLF